MGMGWGGGCASAENSCIEMLSWFSNQVRLWDGLCGCLDSLIRLTRWSELGTMFSSKREDELAALPWQGSRPGLEAIAAHCLRAQIKPGCALNSLSGEATGFTLQVGDATGCALCSSATVRLLNGQSTFLCALVKRSG